MEKAKDKISSSLANLDLSAAKQSKTSTSRKKEAVVADSWDDEDVSDSSDNSTIGDDTNASLSSPGPKSPTPSDIPAAPPPTPVHPSYGVNADWDSLSGSGSALLTSPRSPDGTPSRRPEKTDAVARRMIAAGLGLKAPKQTEEQKAYQRSIKEQEKKRREQEKEAERRLEEQQQKAKAAIWDA